VDRSLGSAGILACCFADFPVCLSSDGLNTPQREEAELEKGSIANQGMVRTPQFGERIDGFCAV
jgi:hypothetical protein